MKITVFQSTAQSIADLEVFIENFDSTSSTICDNVN